MSIRFEPLTAEEYPAWLEHHILGYAEDKVRSGQWGSEGARARARQDTERFLSEGVATPDHSLLHIVDGSSGERVGSLWWCQSERFGRRVAFVFNLEIHPEARRRGHAAAALRRLEAQAQAEGIEAISLHVFAFNHAARALYEKLGFSVTGLSMSRELGGSAGEAGCAVGEADLASEGLA